MENEENNTQPTPTPKPKSNLESLGAIWVRKNQQGGTALSGYVEIDGVKTFVFLLVNKFKTNSKHPDYKIFRSDPNGAGAIKSAPIHSEDGSEVSHEAQYDDFDHTEQENVPDIDTSDIPF